MESTQEIIDAFCHWLPEEYLAVVDRISSSRLHMFQRARNIPVMISLDERFRVMDEFPGYRQIPSLASPSVEALAGPKESPELARRVNDIQAKMVDKYPDRFPGFVGALPLNNPEACVEEMHRGLTTLNAIGFQLFTSVNGLPLDDPMFEQVFACAAETDCPLWLHPIGGPSAADYPGEEQSKYDIWWSLGWPHESSKAMARLVFSGLFERHPNIKIITHHAGGTIPMLEGRLDSGMKTALSRTPAGCAAQACPAELSEPPIDSFRRFYADTATFGAVPPLGCGFTFFGEERMIFASDMPFDPEGGPGYIRSTLKALSKMDISEAQLKSVLSDNFRSIACNPLRE